MVQAGTQVFDDLFGLDLDVSPLLNIHTPHREYKVAGRKMCLTEQLSLHEFVKMLALGL